LICFAGVSGDVFYFIFFQTFGFGGKVLIKSGEVLVSETAAASVSNIENTNIFESQGRVTSLKLAVFSEALRA
jgi:hypothetical protein